MLICGISTVVTFEAPHGRRAPVDDETLLRESIHRSLNEIRYRGPDDRGVWTSLNRHVGTSILKLRGVLSLEYARVWPCTLSDSRSFPARETNVLRLCYFPLTMETPILHITISALFSTEKIYHYKEIRERYSSTMPSPA